MSQTPAPARQAGVPAGQPPGQTPPAGKTPPEGTPAGEQTPPAGTPPVGEQTPPAAGTPPAATPPQEPTPVDISASAAKQIEGLLTDAGLTPKEVAASVTAEDGVTPAIYKALVDKHGEGVASLVKDKLESLNTAGKTAATARDQAVYDQVKEAFAGVTEQDGKETWKELSTWAKTNIADADRAEINKLLKQGGMAAKLAVQELVTAFQGSDNYEQPAQLVTGDGVADNFGSAGLSKSEYDGQLRELLNKGHVYGESKEIAQLDARRMKSIRRGQ